MKSDLPPGSSVGVFAKEQLEDGSAVAAVPGGGTLSHGQGLGGCPLDT